MVLLINEITECSKRAWFTIKFRVGDLSACSLKKRRDLKLYWQ